ncbi:MAG: apolipoprotein N-acyltransferase [Gemmatimonadota bacterium]
MAAPMKRALRGLARMVPPPGERLLPILAGLMLVLSFPPFSAPGLPFVALVPLLLFVAERPDGADGRWSATRAGITAGLVYFGLLLYWLFVALVHYSTLAIPAYLLTTMVLAGFTGAFAAALHRIRSTLDAVPLALAAAALWTALEWVQGNLGDLSFPWLGLGSSLAAYPGLAGAAELVGARGLTFWLALVNGLVATAVLAARRGGRWVRPGGYAALAALLPALWGVVRTSGLEVRPAARVAVVQPNIPEDLKMDASQALDSSMTALENLTRRIPSGSVDLVVWPEVAVPAPIQAAYDGRRRPMRPVRERIRALSDAVSAPIVVGAYGLEADPESGDVDLFNSALLTTAEGFVGEPYHKQRLVPFVERIPFVDPARLEWLIGGLRYFGGLGEGAATDPMRIAAGADGGVEGDEAGFGVLICYESIFADVSRHARRSGADFLVNVTNDAWYGREPWYARTTALWQHPAHLTLRSIEQRVGIARAANTGISMFVEPTGHTYGRTELFEADVRVATVYTTDVVTLYARWGDWLATGATILAALLALGAWWTGRRRADAERRYGGRRTGGARALRR